AALPPPLFPYTTLFRSRIRAVLAEEPERQAPRAQGCARRGHAAGDAQARRSRRRLRVPRPRRRGGAAYAKSHAETGPILWGAMRSEEHTSELQSRENLV